jgi:hypothetical protein
VVACSSNRATRMHAGVVIEVFGAPKGSVRPMALGDKDVGGERWTRGQRGYDAYGGGTTAVYPCATGRARVSV